LPAVVDQSADEAEDAADGTGDVRVGPVRPGSCGRGGGLGRARWPLRGGSEPKRGLAS
jgi:hypothetical protein